MRYFITGGAGFIGSHLVDNLVNTGAVTVYDNLSSGKKEFIQHHLDRDSFRFIQADLLERDWLVRAMKDRNNLPAICGRVCPQETQCEVKCVLGKKGDPVAIGRLERYVGDYELTYRTCPLERPESTGKRVAVAGTGPAGLTCAVDLGRQGHEVVMFESLHSPGGVLVYGIPEFRLPKGVVHAEIDYAAECLGIQVRADAVIGRLYTIDELLGEEGFDAVFLGTGAGLPKFLRIPGINYNGVLSAN